MAISINPNFGTRPPIDPEISILQDYFPDVSAPLNTFKTALIAANRGGLEYSTLLPLLFVGAGILVTPFSLGALGLMGVVAGKGLSAMSYWHTVADEASKGKLDTAELSGAAFDLGLEVVAGLSGLGAVRLLESGAVRTAVKLFGNKAGLIVGSSVANGTGFHVVQGIQKSLFDEANKTVAEKWESAKNNILDVKALARGVLFAGVNSSIGKTIGSGLQSTTFREIEKQFIQWTASNVAGTLATSAIPSFLQGDFDLRQLGMQILLDIRSSFVLDSAQAGVSHLGFKRADTKEIAQQTKYDPEQAKAALALVAGAPLLMGMAGDGGGDVVAAAGVLPLVLATVKFVMTTSSEMSYEEIVSGGYLHDSSASCSSQKASLLKPKKDNPWSFLDGLLITPFSKEEIVFDDTSVRETAQSIRYEKSKLHTLVGLKPTPLHCELDALALSSWLARKGYNDVQIIEIRSKLNMLWHFNSVWSKDAVRYDGIHYAVLVKNSVVDLQSILPPLFVDHYVKEHFPEQVVTVAYHHPVKFRQQLRVSRQYHVARYDNFEQYPELHDDPSLPPPKSPRNRSLRDIIAMKKMRQVLVPQEHRLSSPDVLWDDYDFPYR